MTLFHISKTVCAQSANVMAMATALGKIKIEPKNLTWQAVGALTDDGEEDGSVWAQIG